MLKNSDYIRSRLILSYHPTTSGKLEYTKKNPKTRHTTRKQKQKYPNRSTYSKGEIHFHFPFPSLTFIKI